MFSFFNKVVAENSGMAYDYSFNGIDGGKIKLSDYKNKNVIVIGIPTNNFKQEPGTNDQIKDFCETNFGISFPMTEKINVIGANSHPFYKWAKKDFGMGAIPKWNFHKIVIGKGGKIEDTFASFTKPTSKKFIKLIEKLI